MPKGYDKASDSSLKIVLRFEAAVNIYYFL